MCIQLCVALEVWMLLWLHVMPKYAAIFVTTKLRIVTELVVLMAFLYPLLLISES